MIAGTIVAENYLPLARVLVDSFRRHHPGIPIRVLLAGTEEACRAAERDGLDVIRPADLGLGDLRETFPGYDRKQILTALKPLLLGHLLSGGEPAIFLDADVLVTGTFEPVLEEAERHSMSLTPHVRRPPPGEEGARLERCLLLAGMYNAGFVVVTDREETRRFLAWWGRRVETLCSGAVREGFHYDQRWLDLAPGFLDDLHLVRDPGCNAAYWNLSELEMTREGERFTVNGEPLRFFHFSGFDPSSPEDVTRHVPDWKVRDLGAAADLFRRYKTLVDEAGWEEARNAAWPWDPPPSPTRLPERIRAWL